MPNDDIQDDLTISDDAILIRRVPPWHWNFEEGRPKRSAFHLRKTDEYLSFFLTGETSVDEVIANYTAKGGSPGIVFLRVGDIRALRQGFKIRRRDEPPNPSGHCGVSGEFSRMHQDMLRCIAEVIIAPKE